MTAIAKCAIGLSAISTGVVGTYGTHWYFSTPSNIKDGIHKSNLELLDLDSEITANSTNTESYKKWKELISSKGEEVNSFASLENQEEEHVKIEKIRKKCQEEMNVTYKENNFWERLEKSKLFCAKNN